MYKIIGADQKEYGPVSAEQMRQWVAEGRVNGNTRVQAEGTGLWKPLSEYPEFVGVVPPPPPPSPPTGMSMPLPSGTQNSKMAVWSLIVGAVSMFCCQVIVGPVAIILGVVALSNIKSHPNLKGSGFATAGIILGAIALLLGIVMAYVFLSNPGKLQDLMNQIQNQNQNH